MEIEAKYRIPDRATFDALKALADLAGFTLGRARRKNMYDVYLDTPQRDLLAAGYALRQRMTGHMITLTLKALGGVSGDVHRREEIEQPLPFHLPPQAWPEGPVTSWLRSRHLDLAALVILCEIQQTRHVRPVLEGERLVAEWSLDKTRLFRGAQRASIWELEIELAPGGTEDDLQRLTEALCATFPLEPEPRSKFERALALGVTLSPAERALCTRLAAGSGRYALRARLLLALDANQGIAAITAQQGVSRPFITRWRDAFIAQGIAAVFPPALLASSGFGEKGPAASGPPSDHAPLPVTSAQDGTAPPSGTAGAPVPAAPETRAASPGVDTSPEQAAPEPAPSAPAAPETRPASPGVDASPEQAAPEPAPSAPAAPPRRTSPGLTPTDSLGEAFRKTLRFHLERMLANEPGTRAGEDIEALHDMRVATRRMRAAFLVFGPYVDQAALKPILKGLRRTGRALGAVRDLDVFREKVQHYLDALPAARRGELDPLLETLSQQRAAARTSLLAYLDSPAYTGWVERFQRVLDQPLPEPPPLTDAGPRPYLVSHVIPALIFERWASVRAFGPWLGQPDAPLTRYHQLRIAAKALRYTLEFFSELLGKDMKLCLDRVKRLQDHLGDLQDAVVASGLLRDYLTWGTWSHTGRAPDILTAPVLAPGVAAYLTYRLQEAQTLVADFPTVWATITDASFGAALLTALQPLLSAEASCQASPEI